MERKLGFITATSLVVASMIGTGVFTTTGFFIRDVPSIGAVLFAWVIGGVTALCGALTYAELAAALPENGGEYQLLSRIYHPAIGVIAGFVGLVVGFAAPCAAGALAFGTYLAAVVPGVPPLAAGALVVVLLSALHAFHLGAGSRFQDAFTIGKVLLIALFIAAGLAYADFDLLTAAQPTTVLDGTLSMPFAIGLIYVAFSYSGWNAAAYVAGEVDRPERTLPAALVVGTAIVTLLYLGLNVVFLSAAPASELAGKVEVGHVAAVGLFGESAAKVLSLIIALGLLSTIGAMIMTGARVYEAMGLHYQKLRFITGRGEGGGPRRAIALQAVLSLVMLLSASFDALLSYTGFTLSIGLAVTVLGVFVLRRREPELARPYRVWLYPVTPVVYALLSLWMAAGMVVERPEIALSGLLTVGAGFGVYLLIRE